MVSFVYTQLWFAWYPVRLTQSRRWVWLLFIYRSYDMAVYPRLVRKYTLTR